MNRIPATITRSFTARLGLRFRTTVGPLVCLLFLSAPAPGFGDSPILRYADLTLEELLEITVTSVSKQEEVLLDAAAAIHRISNEEIRRSGATSVPEALRYVPGLTVTSASASHWGISARGFHEFYVSHLLVLVDGRSVYNPLFGGVHWDLQQMLLEDIDRIEVIRGPGATMWGANAVNGVINIVTKEARETQGTLLYGGGGDVKRVLAGGRYGSQLGENTYYRVTSTYHSTDDFRRPDGSSANDAWNGWQGGFRLDHHPQADTTATWLMDGTILNLHGGDSEAYDFFTMARVRHGFASDASLQGQASYDRLYRDEAGRGKGTVDTIDFSLENAFSPGLRNQTIWGVGYRFHTTTVEETSFAFATPDDSYTQKVFSTFAQNEFEIVPDQFYFTAGTKVEHNNYTGIEIQPSIRTSIKPTRGQTVWAAISRAVRTPTGHERQPGFSAIGGDPFAGPGGQPFFPRILSNDQLGSEILWAYELGYRIQPTRRSLIDISTFFNDYSDVISFSPDAPEQFIPPPPGAPPGTPGTAILRFDNIVRVQTYGGEFSLSGQPSELLHLSAGYSLVFFDVKRVSGAGQDQPRHTSDKNPRHQIFARSHLDVSPRTSLGAQVRFMERYSNVSSHITGDLRFAYRLTDQFQFEVVGQNLLQRQHREMGAVPFGELTEVPRGVYGRLICTF